MHFGIPPKNRGSFDSQRHRKPPDVLWRRVRIDYPFVDLKSYIFPQPHPQLPEASALDYGIHVLIEIFEVLKFADNGFDGSFAKARRFVDAIDGYGFARLILSRPFFILVFPFPGECVNNQLIVTQSSVTKEVEI